jgi:ABC-type transport system involved in multi-copper enzyme maturation permease subunit
MRRARQFWHLVQWQLAEATHQRVLWLVAAAAVALVLSVGVLREFNFGAAEARFFVSVGQVTFALGGAVVVALVGPALVAGGLAQRTAHLLLARGVRRSAWVLANLAALAVAVGWLVVLLALALGAMLALHGHAEALPAALRGLGIGAGGVLVWAAAAVFFATVFERPTPASAATLAFALASQLAPVLAHLAARGEGWAGWGWRALAWLVPNLGGLETASGGGAALAVVGYVGVFAGAAVVVFSRREI